uniref:AlNc14C27G2652 protein n=1 Tax=Albugo laibachii Nc14 TaxID=890382 RepID=F0W723_9STRA|nr:AlNc14C27G2652 [Albugo laibachii Nc14]|eukprot:CCA16922.1 AlNc14C27G2652 [Albugo laibachii Nc14]
MRLRGATSFYRSWHARADEDPERLHSGGRGHHYRSKGLHRRRHYPQVDQPICLHRACLCSPSHTVHLSWLLVSYPPRHRRALCAEPSCTGLPSAQRNAPRPIARRHCVSPIQAWHHKRDHKNCVADLGDHIVEGECSADCKKGLRGARDREARNMKNEFAATGLFPPYIDMMVRRLGKFTGSVKRGDQLGLEAWLQIREEVLLLPQRVEDTAEQKDCRRKRAAAYKRAPDAKRTESTSRAR